MRHILLALVLVTGCGADAGGNNASPAKRSGKVDLSTLTGLYEGGASLQPNQICMVSDAPDRAAFGIVVRGANSCAGSGTAERQANDLRLTMSGDQPCTLDARVDGGRVILPAAVPESCAYYCSTGATLAGLSFDKKGSSRQDAMKAIDPVGEALCAGLAAPSRP